MNIWHEWPEEQKNWIKNHEYDLTDIQDDTDLDFHEIY